MRALKVELEGTVTSFRYPHFHVGRQPSYPMPPPATIYGHICSAIGQLISRDAVRFAYSFQYESSGEDLELLHMTSAASGRIPKRWGHPKNIEVQTNVLPRQVLLHPQLTLYLDAGIQTENWIDFFRCPRYPVLLGRSQDLAAYRTVEVVQLNKCEWGYFENALLPWSMRERIPCGMTFQMPKFIDPLDRRRVSWERYIALDSRVWWPGGNREIPVGARKALPQEQDGPVWVDESSEMWGGGHRIVVWHSWN
jgi:CRISPR-associated protein Cas5t